MLEKELPEGEKMGKVDGNDWEDGDKAGCDGGMETGVELVREEER